jgi:hypothetical protein
MATKIAERKHLASYTALAKPAHENVSSNCTKNN